MKNENICFTNKEIDYKKWSIKQNYQFPLEYEDSD